MSVLPKIYAFFFFFSFFSFFSILAFFLLFRREYNKKPSSPGHICTRAYLSWKGLEGI